MRLCGISTVPKEDKTKPQTQIIQVYQRIIKADKMATVLRTTFWNAFS